MKNLTSNEKKLTAIIIVLALALVFLTVYIIADKNESNNNNNNDIQCSSESNNNNNNDNKEENNNDKISEEKIEKLDINSEEVKKLYGIVRMTEKVDNTINSYPYDSTSLDQCIYNQKESKPKDLNCNVSFLNMLKNFIQIKSNNFEYNKYKDENSYTDVIEIKKSELEKALYKLYGDNYSIDDFNSYITNVVGEKDSYLITYNKDKDTYRFKEHGGNFYFSYVETKLIKAEKDKDYIYLYEKVGLTTYSKKKYFSNMIGLTKYDSDENKFIEMNKDKSKNLNGKSIWDYEDDLSTFRYVLKKDKNGEYHLDSMGYDELK